MKKYELSEVTVQNILNYLSEQPYKFVAALIHDIMNEVKLSENKEKELSKPHDEQRDHTE